MFLVVEPFMSKHQQRKSIIGNPKQMYKLPKWNANFSLLRSLPFALGLGLAYGFIFYWMSKFLGGIGDLNYVMGFVGIVVGTTSTLISYRWNIGWALDELVGPIITFSYFLQHGSSSIEGRCKKFSFVHEKVPIMQ